MAGMYSPKTDPKYQWGDPQSPGDVEGEVVVSPDVRGENRVPPGQTRTRKWPVLQAGKVPEVSRHEWKLQIGGLVERPLTLPWNEFRALPRINVFSDFHCVTRWSRLGNLWEGVSTREILERAGVKAEAKFAIVGGLDDGWTTNIPLEDFTAEDALFADTHDGEPLTDEHGGPVRLVVPRLYAWKSAKWVCRVEFAAENAPGFWERLGYHDRGDPWEEQRYR